MDIDWSIVPDGFNWAAQDEDGDIYAYTEEPTDCVNDSEWYVIKGSYILIKESIYWRQTKTRRPQ